MRGWPNPNLAQRENHGGLRLFVGYGVGGDACAAVYVYLHFLPPLL